MIRRKRGSGLGAFEFSFGLRPGAPDASAAAHTAPNAIDPERRINETDSVSLVESAGFTAGRLCQVLVNSASLGQGFIPGFSELLRRGSVTMTWMILRETQTHQCPPSCQSRQPSRYCGLV